MEGSLFLPQGRPSRSPELTCSECGASFRPRRVTDGVEELCDACYDKRFVSRLVTETEEPPQPRNHRLAAD